MIKTGIIRASAIISLLLVSEATSLCAPLLTIDQQNVTPGTLGSSTSPDFLFGQSFRPTLNGIDAIELDVGVVFRPSQVRIALLDGVVGFDGLQGPVIGTTNTLTITEQSLHRFHFDFPATIPLIPGNSYVMRLEPVGPNSNPQFAISLDPVPPIDRYVGGQLLQINRPKEDIANRDFIFIEGLHRIPEPGAHLLMLIAIASNLGRCRRRTESNAQDAPGMPRSGPVDL